MPAAPGSDRKETPASVCWTRPAGQATGRPALLSHLPPVWGYSWRTGTFRFCPRSRTCEGKGEVFGIIKSSLVGVQSTPWLLNTNAHCFLSLTSSPSENGTKPKTLNLARLSVLCARTPSVSQPVCPHLSSGFSAA